MPSADIDDDPLSRALAEERARDSPQERKERLEREAKARFQSQQIDEQIDEDREKAKRDSAIEILLLGQSESGKSTTLKQFQILADQDAFRSQRGVWRYIVYLNLIRSVRKLLTIVSQWRESGQDIPDLDEAFLAAQDNRFLQIQLRLSPLLQIERGLVKSMGLPDDSLPGSPSFPSSPIQDQEYFVRPNTGWMSNLLGRWSGNRVTQIHGSIDPDDPDDPGHIVAACGVDIMELWNSPFVQAVLQQGSLRIEDEGGFFLNDIERVTSPDFVPSDSDIVRCRLKTIGISKHEFVLNRVDPLARTTHIRIYDVGGARSQRATWAPYFDSVKILLFLAPISAFDQYLEEDPRVNRIKDSLELWKSLTSNSILKDVPIVLFLNKCDLLRAKLDSNVFLNKHITSYNGPNDFQNVAEYLLKRFEKIGRNTFPSRDIHVHFTTATDTSSTCSILARVSDLVIREQLRDMRLLS
ncbi:hypothetical protein BS47DRAFT_1328920 [Hydnum rufescens UP504]|uniref:Uncharacterized protein n=1 Tax=Hydnum rufescens UP504 TaxID=1448309 RepID=A0A9P6AZ49_9AGAM|nr:hypothetical protein BS47DRAFT_1328920 [Hydnum rufescens UP504]